VSDNIRVLADDRSNTTTYAYAVNNELQSMTDYNGQMDFTYDELGRMTSRARGSYSASYSYQYDDRMTSVVSTFPGDPFTTSYDYGGDGARRSRTGGGVTTTYNWTGWAIASEEVSGSLTRSYVGRSMAHIDGSNPNTGDYAYYVHDHLGSTCGIFDDAPSPPPQPNKPPTSSPPTASS